ncbi:MAG TPA: prolyl oligopeptidase family serine peptidase [Acidimicrobiales bacterium]|nr:prolyl oligopeptidase family serine peptidase [Acidimicrobiales bacterium]
MTGLVYPSARRLDLVEDLHGRRVADPYRGLEDAGDPATEAWSTAQDDLARRFLDALPGRDHLRRRLRELIPGVISAPMVVGHRRFFSRREPDQEHATFCVEEAGEVRVLLDPAAIDPSLSTTLDGAVPSKEGDRLAYLLSEGGREESTYRVLDVASGEVVDGPIVLGRSGSMAWRVGGEEIFYVRGEGHFDRRVYRHRLGADAAHDEVLFGEGRDKSTYYGVSTSLDGRWLTLSASIGTEPRNDLYLLDLERAEAGFVAVQEGIDAFTSGGVHSLDGRLYLLTDLDAPRGRLCVTDPSRPQPEHWTDLVPETDDVLSDYALTQDALVVVRTHDVASAITVHDKATGVARGAIELPGLGEAGVVARPDGGHDVWIGYTDFLTPYRVLHHDLATGRTTVWADPPGAVPPEGMRVDQVFVTSADGTRVPAFVVRREGLEVDGARPTILYGYGGFNVPLAPGYSSTIATWVEAGGVYVVANLRGGSEYGEQWHRDGMREHKQHVFDDFLAVADWLVDAGYTSSDHLAISGGSNGGLLVGAALTQRPQRFRAVVCSAPLLDMVRYERFGLGVTWNDEYGTADDPTELGWLLSYSPYHRVVDGTAYPAVLFTVFEGDTRVDPLHARKVCAALQHATTSDPAERPVLIRREKDVGHGVRAVSRTVDLTVDTMSFLAAQVGLRLP